MSMKSLAGLLLFLSAIVGCAQIAPNVKPAEKPDSTSAYLYGDFAMSGRGAASIALQVQEVTTGKTYLVKFRKDKRLVVTKVEPGKYVINRALALGIGNEIKRTQVVQEPPYGVEFEVAAGRAYYLGSHSGEYGLRLPLQVYWKLLPVTDSFSSATQTLTETYPEMRDFLTSRAFGQ